MKINVVIYGRSVFITGIKQNLDRIPELNVFQIDCELAEMNGIEKLKPDILIIEAKKLNYKLVDQIFKNIPDIKLITFNTEGDYAFKLLGERESIKNINNLSGFILGK